MALGVVLLVVPIGIAYACGIDVAGKVVSAFLMMLARIGMLGVAVYFLMQWGGVALPLLTSLALLLYSVALVIVRARLKFGMFIVPVGAGMLSAVLVCGSVLLFANVAIGSDFCVRYVLPAVALLSGSMSGTVADSLAVYYMGLRNHSHLYYYMVGNGATRAEALRYLQRRAVAKSFVPGVRHMSTLAAGVSPVVMWTMIVCGATALTAAAMQVLVVLAVFASSVIATTVALAVARRYVVDGYAALRVKDNDPSGDVVDSESE